MKQRFTHWKTTIPGLAVLIFLGLCVFVRPVLLDTPDKLVLLGLGLLALFAKGKSDAR
jgi:hypothetical protein